VEVILEFDGACEPVNPGGVGTYGFILRGLPGFDEPVAIGGVAGSGQGMTNNIAEYTGLRRALESLDALVALPADAMLVIRGDSQLVVKQLAGEWRCNHAHLIELRDRCRELLTRIGCQWRAEWIPREENAAADALTGEAYERETGRKMPVRQRNKKG
jgi:ribonuclease HI